MEQEMAVTYREVCGIGSFEGIGDDIKVTEDDEKLSYNHPKKWHYQHKGLWYFPKKTL